MKNISTWIKKMDKGYTLEINEYDNLPKGEKNFAFETLSGLRLFLSEYILDTFEPKEEESEAQQKLGDWRLDKDASYEGKSL